MVATVRQQAEAEARRDLARLREQALQRVPGRVERCSPLDDDQIRGRRSTRAAPTSRDRQGGVGDRQVNRDLRRRAWAEAHRLLAGYPPRPAPAPLVRATAGDLDFRPEPIVGAPRAAVAAMFNQPPQLAAVRAREIRVVHPIEKSIGQRP
jgi:hypothetical protein